MGDGAVIKVLGECMKASPDTVKAGLAMIGAGTIAAIGICTAAKYVNDTYSHHLDCKVRMPNYVAPAGKMLKSNVAATAIGVAVLAGLATAAYLNSRS